MAFHSRIKSVFTLIAAIALCLISTGAHAQQQAGGDPLAPDNGGHRPVDSDFSTPITIDLYPAQRQFDIRDIEVSAEVDKVTLEDGLKAGSVPIRITVTNRGKEDVVFKNIVALGDGINIYAEDEAFHKKVIFPSSTLKAAGEKELESKVPGGQSITVLLQAPLPVAALDPKYRGYLAGVRVYVPRLSHVFEVFSNPFPISTGK